MLQDVFTRLVSSYTEDGSGHILWNEIETKYSESGRYYHTLLHLESILYLIDKVKDQVEDMDTLLFSMFYHDIIYNVSWNDNEKRSVDLAAQRLGSIHFPPDRAENCYQHILATRHHDFSINTDTNIFTDADIAILGQDRTAYEVYCRQIRSEYAIYPDAIYIPGRKEVLNRFLQRERIFKTPVFFDLFEKQARLNLQWEIGTL